MTDFKEKHLDFVMKHYRAGAMDTSRAIRKFMQENDLDESVPVKGRGRVWIYSLSAVAAALLVGFVLIHLYMGQRVVLQTEERWAEFILPDQSQVTLTEGSRLIYPKHRFGRRVRQVEMEGRAFFAVAKNPSCPFEIVAGPSLVRVLGTQFQVDTRRGEPEVHVLEGKVFMGRQGSEDGVILTDGMKAVLPMTAAAPQVCGTSAENDFAWVTHRFIFNETPLAEVLKTLSDYYEVELSSPTEYSLNKKLTGTFEVESLEVILDLIEAALEIEIVHP